MKLSDVRPCDHCAGPVGMTFYVVRASLAVVDMGLLREHDAMARYFNAPMGSLIVENFAPTDDAVTIAAEFEDPVTRKKEIGWTEVLLCVLCYARQLGLAETAAGDVAERRKAAAAGATS